MIDFGRFCIVTVGLGVSKADPAIPMLLLLSLTQNMQSPRPVVHRDLQNLPWLPVLSSLLAVCPSIPALLASSPLPDHHGHTHAHPSIWNILPIPEALDMPFPSDYNMSSMLAGASAC